MGRASPLVAAESGWHARALSAHAVVTAITAAAFTAHAAGSTGRAFETEAQIAALSLPGC